MVIGAMGDGCRHVEAASRSLEPSCVGVRNVVSRELYHPATNPDIHLSVVSAKSQVVKDGALQVVGGRGETAPRFCWVLNGHGMCLQCEGPQSSL